MFYCFSRIRTYQDLDAGYLGPGAPVFFEQSVFFNAHEVPNNTKTVSLSNQGQLSAGKDVITLWNGIEWVYQLWACKLGIRQVPDRAEAVDSDAELQRLSIIRFYKGEGNSEAI